MWFYLAEDLYKGVKHIVNNYGFIKVAAASPKLKVGNTRYNVDQIIEACKQGKEANILVFPELCVTGYTCGDLFSQNTLLDRALIELKRLMNSTTDQDTLIFVGLPINVKDDLYNCAVAIQRGKIRGIVPKIYTANYNEFYEKRWFASGINIMDEIKEVEVFGEKYPFGNIIFKNKEMGYGVAADICEDLWAPIPRSSYLTLNGANIIVNLSASNELVGKSDYRRQLIRQFSASSLCGYVYSSAGVYESTTDTVFGGDCIICENGEQINTSNRFSRKNEIIFADLDVNRLSFERRVNRTFSDGQRFNQNNNYTVVDIEEQSHIDMDRVNRNISPTPFVPSNHVQINERCKEIFNIQVSGLAKRLEHIGMERAVIGVSGGLDSTLALLVVYQTFNLLDIPMENVIAVTMPGFGTTDNTYNNAVGLIKSLGMTFKEIDIKDACLQHFKDIGHDPDIHDVTYENVQARERTQILMDLANKSNGLVIGTGDLSELALGWATYNGDHMSMYSVNCSIPKTLVKFLVQWVADNNIDEETRKILYSIINTPISPELLPPDKEGKIAQKTESIIGPYELHDFFLYYTIRQGTEPKKLMIMAERAFGNKYSLENIKKYLKMFYKRFFTQQFKRSCLPDGPKVGTVSLSPRGDWRMPSDADYQIWIDQLD